MESTGLFERASYSACSSNIAPKIGVVSTCFPHALTFDKPSIIYQTTKGLPKNPTTFTMMIPQPRHFQYCNLVAFQSNPRASTSSFYSSISWDPIHRERHCYVIFTSRDREERNCSAVSQFVASVKDYSFIRVDSWLWQEWVFRCLTYPSEKSACSKLRYVSHLLPITFPQVKHRTGMIILKCSIIWSLEILD